MTAAPEAAALTEPSFNRGFRRMFRPGRMTLGLIFPIESYGLAHWDMPIMAGQDEIARAAETLGFAALWVRDVPLRDPAFGDVGQIYDPWAWLGVVCARTRDIALATGSIILPLRHPLHVAKAAASIDRLSGGRLVMGVGSGDRPVEFPAFGVPYEERGPRMRESMAFIRRAWASEYPFIRSPLGILQNADLVPKPAEGGIAMLVTGHSQQSLEWIAENSDGWLTYARHPAHQKPLADRWRALTTDAAPAVFKPFAQGLHIDLAEDADEDPRLIHNGYRLGRKRLIELFEAQQYIGVNHCILNFKFGRRPAADMVREIAEEVLPLFPTPAEDGAPARPA